MQRGHVRKAFAVCRETRARHRAMRKTLWRSPVARVPEACSALPGGHWVRRWLDVPDVAGLASRQRRRAQRQRSPEGWTPSASWTTRPCREQCAKTSRRQKGLAVGAPHLWRHFQHAIAQTHACGGNPSETETGYSGDASVVRDIFVPCSVRPSKDDRERDGASRSKARRWVTVGGRLMRHRRCTRRRGCRRKPHRFCVNVKGAEKLATKTSGENYCSAPDLARSGAQSLCD